MISKLEGITRIFCSCLPRRATEDLAANGCLLQQLQQLHQTYPVLVAVNTIFLFFLDTSCTRVQLQTQSIMTIIYSVICRAKDATILTEVCDRDLKGTFGSVWLELFQHLRDHPDFFKDGDLKTFVQRNQAEMDFFSHFLEACSAVLNKDDDINNSNPETFFHIFFNNGVFYGCLGDDSDTRDQKV